MVIFMALIATSALLKDFCQPLLASKVALEVGIDMEFMRETTYWPRLCLIQVSSSLASSGDIVLIDPLAGIDLRPFQALLAAPHLTKVFHSGRQDLEICWHEWRALPVNYFDTQVAAMVCGLGESIGYGALVKALFAQEIVKDSQRTEWSRRPLTARQLDYARADVAHLLPAYRYLKDHLNSLNRWEWMEEDLNVLLNPLTYQTDPLQAWKRVYSTRSKNLNMAVLQDICACREATAMQLNVNRGRLLKDETIHKIAMAPPLTFEEFKRVAGVFLPKLGSGPNMAYERARTTLPDKILKVVDELSPCPDLQGVRNLRSHSPSSFKTLSSKTSPSAHSPVKAGRHLGAAYLTPAFMRDLFEVYQSALCRSEETWPKAPEKYELTPLNQQRLNILQTKLNETAQNLKVPTRLIAPKKALLELAEGKTEGNIILNGWRGEVFRRNLK